MSHPTPEAYSATLIISQITLLRNSAAAIRAFIRHDVGQSKQPNSASANAQTPLSSMGFIF
jgi:hypothetical protein